LTVIAVPAAVLLAAGLLLALVRLVRGPSMLDRVVALDVLLAVIVCALGVQIAVSGTLTYLPVLVVLALLGFIGTVTVARLLHGDTEGGGR
jgi:multicomponent Na+:H+ antiporter subunit F